jgi:hypothetical protein
MSTTATEPLGHASEMTIQQAKIRRVDLVSEQHSESESECHDTPDAMQSRSTVTSSSRTSENDSLPEAKIIEPSAVDAASLESEDCDHSASNTVRGVTD